MSKVYGSKGSRLAEKFVVRLPEGMRQRIMDVATEHRVAMNAVVVDAIEKEIIAGRKWQPTVGDAVYFQDLPYVFTISGFSGTRDEPIIHAGCAQLGGRHGSPADFEPCFFN